MDPKWLIGHKIGWSSEIKMSRTHAILQRRPELVASATGYVISTPSSMQAGMRGRANIPNRQREKPTLIGWSGRRDTCGTGTERRRKEKRESKRYKERKRERS